MQHQIHTFPCAIADGWNDDEVTEALRWLIGQTQNDSITMWVPQKNTLRNNPFLEQLANDPLVKLETGRGVSNPTGAIIAFYPDRTDLGDLNGKRTEALAVVTWTYPLNVWANEVDAVSFSAWGEDEFMAEPATEVQRLAFRRLSERINLSNALSSPFEKRDTLQSLHQLRDGGQLPSPETAMELAAANSWGKSEIKQLGEWVKKMHEGRNLRV